ncbi:MAG: YifB family Mg chelatase-like AAA ATPase [Pseudomonadota bacterium]
MSLAIIHTRARLGIDSPAVTVEVHLSNGLPSLSIVGLPETAVKESKDRVRSAIINSHFEFPARRITINLAPADLPKEGSRFDLAIAMGILAASKQIATEELSTFEFIGELALSGELRPCYGVLAAAIACGRAGRQLIIPSDSAEEASLCESTQIFHGKHLLEICQHLDTSQHPSYSLQALSFTEPHCEHQFPDFNEVRGQQFAKRALEIAAAGRHNLLFYGPPGTGKTMLASRLPGIMPPLTQEQAIEVACIHSLCGKNYQHWRIPPFRSPHHTASSVALVGGGSQPRPGEVSLSHRGILFLDEFPEFQRSVLEVLREPLESGEISISRASAQLTFPADFQLIAAMNPCPCGYLNNRHTQQSCRCTAEQIQRYRQKISGPLLDRIDLHIPVVSLSSEELLDQDNVKTEPSSVIQQRVISVRKRQQTRQGCSNAELSNKQLIQVCQLRGESKQLLNTAIKQLGLSARAYHRVVKVARTIADLDSKDSISNRHIAEALSLRSLDRENH